MAQKSIKSILAEASLVTPEQFQEWSKAWRTAVEGGSTESLLGFFARETGISDELFLHRLAVFRSAAPLRKQRGAEEDQHQSRLPVRRDANEV